MILADASLWYLLQLAHIIIAWAVYLVKGADSRDYGGLFLITCYAGLSLAIWSVFSGVYLFLAFGFLHALGGYVLWFTGTKLWGMIVNLMFLGLLLVDVSIVSAYLYTEVEPELYYAHVKGGLSHAMLLLAIFGRNQPDRFYPPARRYPFLARRIPFISREYQNIQQTRSGREAE